MSVRAWAVVIVVALIIIAGSLYFLIERGSTRPTSYDDIGTELGGGRVERTGYALTTPDGWAAWEPSPSFQDWWGADRVVDLWLEPASTVETWWMSTCDIGEKCTRERMVAAGGQAYCWVIDDTDLAVEAGWTSPATPTTNTATALAEQDGWTGLGSALEQVPGGEAGVVRGVDPNGWEQSLYHLTDGERWYRLICGVLDSDVEPGTIAETFEFLSATSQPLK